MPDSLQACHFRRLEQIDFACDNHRKINSKRIKLPKILTSRKQQVSTDGYVNGEIDEDKK